MKKEKEKENIVIINNKKYKNEKTNKICYLSLESNEDFYIVMTIYDNDTSSEIRYFSKIEEANNFFNLINNEIINKGWVKLNES